MVRFNEMRVDADINMEVSLCILSIFSSRADGLLAMECEVNLGSI